VERSARAGFELAGAGRLKEKERGKAGPFGPTFGYFSAFR
jgi:hypothetical protein